MMPTIWTERPLIRIIRWSTDSSPPYSRCQISNDRMATGAALGTESAGVNQRPRYGATPSAGISSGVTLAVTGRLGGVVSMFTAPIEYAPTLEKACAWSRNSTNSGMDIQNWLKPSAGNWLVMYSSRSACG